MPPGSEDAGGATAPADTSETAGGLSDAAKGALALVGGCLLGVFLGPDVAVLVPVSKGLLKLLNMLSLPFVIFGLIHGIGQIPLSRFTVMASAGGKALFAVTVAGLAACWAVACLFPTIGNAAFLGPVSDASAADSSDLLSQLIPENPFEALATGGIPAVVFFCFMFTWCLMRLEGREALLKLADLVYRVLEEMWETIARLLPLITFCLSTTAVGLLDDDLLARLRVFFIGVVVMTLFFALLIIPVVIAMVTAQPFRCVFRRCIVPMQISFLTGSTFAVLPLVVAAVVAMVRSDATEAAPAEGADSETEAEISTLTLLGYQFPLIGSLFVVLYVLFAATAFDRHLDVGSQMKLAVMGPLALFGSSTGASAFLCDMLGLPYDAVALQAGLDEMISRFDCALETGSLLCLTVLTWMSVHRPRSLSYARLALTFGVLVAGLGIICRGASGSLSSPPSIRHYYTRHALVLSPRVTVRQARDIVAAPPSSSWLTRVGRGQSLRAGVIGGDRPPFTYRNEAGEIVGYSVELASLIADSLRVPLDLVVLSQGEDWKQALEDRRIDVVLSPVAELPERIRQVSFPVTFGSARPVLVFRDSARAAITPRCREGNFSGLRVGVLRGALKLSSVQSIVPGAALVPVDGPDTLLTDPSLDAVLWLDVEAAAWEITHIEYGHLALTAPPFLLGYATRLDDAELQTSLSDLFEALEARGDLRRLREDWMMGRAQRATPPSPARRLWRWLFGGTVVTLPR